MKVKIFQARRLDALEQAVNQFLETHEVTIQHTQFSTVYGQDLVEHIMFHTLVMFYWPRVDETRDPFQEEAHSGECVECGRNVTALNAAGVCEGCVMYEAML